MSKVRWGILSTAKIGLNAVIPAMQRGGHSEIMAIASRNGDKARAAAKNLGIPASYGSYEELLEDNAIQAVYIPLPNHLHVPWTIKCLEAGKHVLCEKPIGVNRQEAEQLLAATSRFPQLKVMEAFMYRFHPQWKVVLAELDKKTIGDVKWIQSSFTYNNTNPADIRNQAECGGGGLLDIGCYCISSARFLFKTEPTRVFAVVEFDPTTGIDRLTSGILEFPNGRSTFTCSTQLERFQRVEVFGSLGKIEIESPFNPMPDTPPGVAVRKGSERMELKVEAANHYTIQGDRFSMSILENAPVPTPLSDALATMKVIDAIFQSARDGGWVTL